MQAFNDIPGLTGSLKWKSAEIRKLFSKNYSKLVKNGWIKSSLESLKESHTNLRYLMLSYP